MICCMSQTGKLPACTGHTVISDWRLKSRVPWLFFLPRDNQSYSMCSNCILISSYLHAPLVYWAVTGDAESMAGRLLLEWNIILAEWWHMFLLCCGAFKVTLTSILTIMGGQRRWRGDIFIGSADSQPNQQCHGEILDLKGNYGAIIVAKLSQMQIVL